MVRIHSLIVGVLAGVQASFADGDIAIVDEPFAIGGNGPSIAQRVADKVVRQHYRNTPIISRMVNTHAQIRQARNTRMSGSLMAASPYTPTLRRR